MEEALRSLRDIDGVLGSFMLDQHGQLLARDMPGVFDDGALRSASQRLGQLRAAFETEGQNFESCTARFGSHLLVLRSAATRTLCVLCPVGTNLTTLQMGINLVARRAQELPASMLPPPPTRASAPPPAPMPALSSVPAPAAVPYNASLEAPSVSHEIPHEPQSTTRFFRGRPVP
jgi:hypothetical protein